MRRSPLLLGALLLAGTPALAAPPDRVDYNRDVRPILSNHCYACHGPDDKARKAGLRLDRKEDAFAELESGGHALVAGKPADSALVRRVVTKERGEVMPPPRFGKPLSPAQVDTLRRWVEQGADWQGHWAYLPVKRPALPAVKDAKWGRTPIDAFVLARLEAEGLKASPEADRHTLVRRLTFDLTGLPPTPAEVEAFVKDERPDAYEKLVDRLMASPAFGERWAMHWLDLARFADTNGYHIDNHRDMWLYRDWVINAFNDDMPFDRFTVEQLAGDLLPGATLPQRIATGFNRNNMVNFEGGADPREYHTKYVVDRVVTTSTVWLGTTIGCAECHDHKYDPFTMKDFYSLYAFFNNVPENGLDGSKENPVPSIKVPTAAQEKRLAELKAERAALEAKAAAEVAKVPADDPTAPGEKPAEPREVVWVDDDLPAGASPQGNEAGDSWKWVTAPARAGKRASRRSSPGLTQHFFTGANPPLTLAAGDRLFAYVHLDPKDPPKTVMLQFNDGTWEHRAYWGEDKCFLAGQPDTAAHHHMGPLPKAGEWARLEVPAAAVGLGAGSKLNGWAFTQFDGTAHYDSAGVVTTGQTAVVYDNQAAWEPAAKGDAKLPADVKAALAVEPAKRTDAQKKAVRDWFVRKVAARLRPTFDPIDKRLDEIAKAEAAVNAEVPATMVMQEMDKPRDTHVLIRGDWQSKGDKVTAAVPASLPPLPKGEPANRLGLARWLVSPDHPLTARVTVNRYWEQLFGAGIVKTGEDFGSQGEWPSHPELLDWLASEYREGGWKTKALLKTMVMSSAYRQSARVSPEVLKADPYNRLLARGPRFRLPAEMIRDNALAVSGLLNHDVGGPSVRPYQPAGLWEAIAFGGDFSSQKYVQDRGKSLYRRGLYTYWKRSLPHPSLVTFDAPNREVCTDRRPRTNTPLQALVLMNDPIYVEAARVLGQRVLKEADGEDARLRLAFRLCTAREAGEAELKVLRGVLSRQREKFAADPAAAKKLTSIGEAPRPADLDPAELAAWTALGNLLLNLDEVVTKG